MLTQSFELKCDFLILGLDTILPNKEPYWPQTGKKTTIVIGEPLYFDDFVRDMKAAQKTPVS